MLHILIIQIVLIGFCYANLPPEFISDLSPPIVKEDTPVGTRVFTLVGRDPENTPLRYGLEGTDFLSVNPSSGVVSIAKPLDREDKDTIRLIVSVEDQVMGADNNVVRIPLDLVVIDVNDVPPLFSRNNYEAHIPEDATPGTTVLSGISLTDIDQVGEILTVTCYEEDDGESKECEHFAVIGDQQNSRVFRGHLSLRMPLSYALKNRYDLILRAHDGINMVSVPLRIYVKDVQNTPPIFKKSFSGIIKEDAPIGTLILTLEAYDGDTGNSRSIIYELNNNPYGFFLLDPDSGELRTAKPLNRESLPDSSGIINLSVTAYESENGVKMTQKDSFTQADVRVTIRDVNDEPPTFNEKEYRVSVPENIPPNTPIPDLNMVIFDADSGKNSIFSIRLAETSGRFSIEPTAATGSTSLSVKVKKGSLDYENPNERQFIVLAIAEETRTDERLSSTATIHVTVTDVNDNVPKFPQEAYTAVISEKASSGTVVTTINANDRDSGVYGTDGLIYSLYGNGAERFIVDRQSGVITVAPCETPGTANCLDYENRKTYFLTYEATDNNGKGHKAQVPIRITLKDENDNTPRFLRSSYRAVIQEGAAQFDPHLIIQADDPDQSSVIKYSIIGGDFKDLFVIDESSGQISIKNNEGLNLANKHRKEIILTVEASDGIGSHTAKVRIFVKDVNNNAPQFQAPFYKASVQEIAPIGTTVEQISATDLDSGKNAAIEYSILKGGYDDFIIDKITGTVTISRQLNYDHRSFYSIEIIASDGGTPQLSSSVFLNVTVIDNNNKNPYFTPTTQRVTVKENIPVDTIFYKLKADDLDAHSVDYLHFELEKVSAAVDKEGNPLPEFQRDALKELIEVMTSGEVKLLHQFNRNSTTEITLSVVVTDTTATEPQSGTGFLIITILDVNNHPPSFPLPWSKENPYIKVKVSEELPLGSVITSLPATDIDSNIEGYNLISSGSLLIIDYATGVVTVNDRLDYEKEDTINITVVAKDTGIPQLSSTATLIVELENINDEEPIFERDIYDGSVHEHSPPGTPVIAVKATDKDKGHLGAITYSLAGDHKQYFTINSNGEVAVAQGANLDREKLSDLRIRAVATDSGPESSRLQTSVPVHIKVIDINDHSPIFVRKMFFSSITENLPIRPPVPVVQIKANDEDIGINAQLNYRITGGTGQKLFRLEPSTGIVYPKKHLSAPNVKMYKLDVEVRDQNGKGTKPDYAEVEITVFPQNQNKPVFTMPPYSDYKSSISENSTSNQIVMTVHANDKDTGKNGKVRYHFRINEQNVQDSPEFHIDSISGVITLKKTLDREHTSFYKLVLVAKDQGSPISYETLVVTTIEVQDVNDHLPTFSSNRKERSYVFTIQENLPKNTLIGQVRAEDPDIGKNGIIYYYMTTKKLTSKFYIDKSNGNIFSTKPLDREEMSSYNMIIKASNDPNLLVDQISDTNDASFAYVTISVEDENDTPPKFEEAIFYAGVPYSAEIERLVRTVEAQDNDKGINGSIFYSIRSSIFYRPGEAQPVGSIVPSPFNISSDGRIFTAVLMAPYKHYRFVLEIMAKENAYPHRVDYCQVHIWVWERNELIKVVLEEKPEMVVQSQNLIAGELSHMLEGRVVVDEIRYYMHKNNSVSKDWSEMLIHVVNKSSHLIPPEQVLKKVDRGFSAYSDKKSTAKIHHIYPVAMIEQYSEEVDGRIAGLIALLVALFLGLVSFVVVCCCLRYWSLSPAKSKEHLIHRNVMDDDLGLNTTENPLWVDQKMKRYEEQELSMHVLSEFDASINNAAIANGNLQNCDEQSNAYATIQKSHSGTIRSMKNLPPLHISRHPMGGDDNGENNDYATLEHLQKWNSSGTLNSNIGPKVPGIETPKNVLSNDQIENPGVHQFANSFTGSTFQPPDVSMANRPLPEEPTSSNQRHVGVDRNGEPCIVAELI